MSVHMMWTLIKITMRIIYITLIAATLFVGQSFSQQAKAWNNWYFGWFAAMTFNSGSPVGISGSNMISEEGSASYSDDNGQLLFYTNGGKGDSGSLPPGAVWNRNNQIMPNGNLLYAAGCSSSPQSSLIIPKTGTSIYYLYTMGCAGALTGLRESIIDMSLDNGLGDLTQVGTQISASTNLSEGLTATKHANGTDYWIIVHSDSGNEFYVYPHTAAGIGTPTSYAIGNTPSVHGQIKISASGTVIACGEEVYSFNNATGAITNPRSIGRSAWGRSFSPSGRFLYVSGALGVGNIYQYDLQASNLAASEVEVLGGGVFTGPMQLGPDGKIYVAVYSNQSVSVINSPELAGAACNIGLYQVPLSASCQLGLPNFIDSYYYELHPTSAAVSENQLVFDIYPNPASSKIRLRTDAAISEIRIFSITGAVLKKMGANEVTAEIDCSDLESGTYFLQVISDKGTGIKELVVN